MDLLDKILSTPAYKVLAIIVITLLLFTAGYLVGENIAELL